MKITVIDYTENAKEILIFSKRTRLNMTSVSFSDVVNMSDSDKDKELKYVFGTIKSSLEFVNYTILIEDVTRAFTHQLVRHRVGVSFAQQSMRTVDMSGFNYYVPESIKALKRESKMIYHNAMGDINKAYCDMIDSGVNPEDARGILPTNILTNILMKINLRSLSDMMSSRLCNRTQKEFRDVMEDIKSNIINIHPFLRETDLLSCYCEKEKHCYFRNGKGCGKYE